MPVSLLPHHPLLLLLLTVMSSRGQTDVTTGAEDGSDPGQTLSPELKDFLQEQQTIRCATVACSAGKVCVLDGSMARCVAAPPKVPPPPTMNTNRLSRSQRMDGLLSSLSRLSRTPVPSMSAHSSMTVPTKCFLGRDPGRCLGAYPRYFYNSRSGKCEHFTFGGCGGNSNQFVSHEDCHQTCVNSNTHGLPFLNNYRLSRTSTFGSSLFNSGVYGKPMRGDVFGSNLFRTPVPDSGTSTNFEKPPQQPNRCFLPAESGPCEAAFTRYFYNHKTLSCERFSFGGCGGNLNNFHTFIDCQNVCVHMQESMPKPHQSRNGPAPVLPTLKSNSHSDPNPTSRPRPKPRGDALKVPAGWSVGYPPAPPNSCHLSYSVGVCHGREIRFYYNINTNQCERFIYSGCGGNANNFKNLQDCRRYCVGPEMALSQQQPSSVNVANIASQTTSPQTTTVRSLALPSSGKHCFMKPDVGPCNLKMKMFFFNETARSCDVFHYGGCGGNGNKFESLDACKRDCDFLDMFKASNPINKAKTQSAPISSPASDLHPLPSELVEVPSTCLLPPIPGPCTASFERWHFSQQTGTCEKFVYGGCKPNANNFMTQQLCLEMCATNTLNSFKHSDSNLLTELAQQLKSQAGNASSMVSLNSGSPFPGVSSSPPKVGQMNRDMTCSLPADAGLCTPNMESWFYDSHVRACRTFMFSGCGGNNNRFSTEELCVASCAGY